MSWKVPIGKTYKEVVYHDFDSTPHMVGGGTTRSSDLNLIKGIVTSLIMNNPKHVEFYLIDLKAGVEFYKYRKIKQVKMVATNVGETHDLLSIVMKKLEAQKEYYRDNNWYKIIDTHIKYRKYEINE